MRQITSLTCSSSFLVGFSTEWYPAKLLISFIDTPIAKSEGFLYHPKLTRWEHQWCKHIPVRAWSSSFSLPLQVARSRLFLGTASEYLINFVVWIFYLLKHLWAEPNIFTFRGTKLRTWFLFSRQLYNA